MSVLRGISEVEIIESLKEENSEHQLPALTCSWKHLLSKLLFAFLAYGLKFEAFENGHTSEFFSVEFWVQFFINTPKTVIEGQGFIPDTDLCWTTRRQAFSNLRGIPAEKFSNNYDSSSRNSKEIFRNRQPDDFTPLKGIIHNEIPEFFNIAKPANGNLVLLAHVSIVPNFRGQELSDRLVSHKPVDRLKLTYLGLISPTAENRNVNWEELNDDPRVISLLTEIGIEHSTAFDLWRYYQGMVEWRNQRFCNATATSEFLEWAQDQGFISEAERERWTNLNERSQNMYRPHLWLLTGKS